MVIIYIELAEVGVTIKRRCPFFFFVVVFFPPKPISEDILWEVDVAEVPLKTQSTHVLSAPSSPDSPRSLFELFARQRGRYA